MSTARSLGLRTFAREIPAFVHCCKGFEGVESAPAFQNFSPCLAAVDFRLFDYSSGVIPEADPLRTVAGCDIASWEPTVGGNPTAATYE